MRISGPLSRLARIVLLVMLLATAFASLRSRYIGTSEAAAEPPLITAWPNFNKISMGHFTPNAMVTLTVYDMEGGDVILGPLSLPTSDSGFAEWRSSPFDGDEFFDLRVGHYIEVTDHEMGMTKTLVVIYVTLDRLDHDADIASGTAPPFARGMIPLKKGVRTEILLHIAADASGDWVADFGAEGMNVLPFMFGVAMILDDDDDATCDEPPSIQLNLGEAHAYLGTESFTPDATVTIEVYDAPGGNLLYGPQSHTTDGEGRVEPELDLRAHSVRPVFGYYIIMTDEASGYSKTLVVPDDTVNPLDYVNDVVTGTALPSSPVDVFVDTPPGLRHVLKVTADESGNWTADFGAIGADLTWESRPIVWVADEDIDQTWIPALPSVTASLTYDWILFTDFDTPAVELEVFDSMGGNLVFGPQTYSPDQGEWVAKPGVDLLPGHYIMATDGLSGRVKDLVLGEVSVTRYDIARDTIAGTAPPHATVEVDVTSLPFNIFDRMRVVADGDGFWTADFGTHGFDIAENMSAQAKVPDEDYDWTAAQPLYRVLLPCVARSWLRPATERAVR